MYTTENLAAGTLEKLMFFLGDEFSPFPRGIVSGYSRLFSGEYIKRTCCGVPLFLGGPLESEFSATKLHNSFFGGAGIMGICFLGSSGLCK